MNDTQQVKHKNHCLPNQKESESHNMRDYQEVFIYSRDLQGINSFLSAVEFVTIVWGRIMKQCVPVGQCCHRARMEVQHTDGFKNEQSKGS